MKQTGQSNMTRHLRVATATYLFLVSIFVASLVSAVRIGEIMFEKEPLWQLSDGIPSVKHKTDYFNSIKDVPKYLNYIQKGSDETLDLGPATEKIYRDGRDMPQLVRCDKYFKLFDSQEYRTQNKIDELLKDDLAFDSIEQRQANFPAKLSTESNFNSLYHIRSMYKNYLEQGVGIESTLDINVQQDLLECTQQYLSRHLRAIEDVNNFVWTRQKEIESHKDDRLNMIQEQFKTMMSEIIDFEDQIDSEEPQGNVYTPLENRWLSKVYAFNRLVQSVRPIVPDEVEKFMKDSRREPVFIELERIQDRVDQLKHLIMDYESDSNVEQNRYRDVLVELNQIVRENKGWLTEEAKFLDDPKREAILIGASRQIYEEEDESDYVTEEKNQQVSGVVGDEL